MAGRLNRRVLVTGGSGFVARALLSRNLPGIAYVASSRKRVEFPEVTWCRSPDLGPSSDWKPLLDGVDAVVHLAGRAHVRAGADITPYFAENCDGTLKLARDAQTCGISRFIYVSSAKVVGDESGAQPLNEDSDVHLEDPYAQSKRAAEQGLRALGGDMGISILRPPLVYGPGVKANFLSLLSAIGRGLPLPLGGIENRRSLIAVENLASAILACLQSGAATGRTYHVTDGAPVSTPALVRALSAALGRPARLFAVSPRLLEIGGALIERGDMVKRLTRSFELDDRAIRRELGWQPPVTFDAGIRATARWYQGLCGREGQS